MAEKLCNRLKQKAILESFEEAASSVLDRKGKLIDANKKFEEISGYQRSELVGKTTLFLAGQVAHHKAIKCLLEKPPKQNG